MNQFEMKKLAYQSQLRNRALQVLLYLIDRSDHEQTCFPAVPTISRELHISISTVKRAMRELVVAGYVAKESRFRKGNRGQTSNLYTLHFPMSKGASEEIAASDKKSDGNVQTERVEQESIEPKSVFVIDEYTGCQCGVQTIDNDNAKIIKVEENSDRTNDLNVVSEAGHKGLELIDCHINKGDGMKISNSIVMCQNRKHDYMREGNIRKYLNLLLKCRNILICILQWTGEGVNLIPP